MLVLIFRPLFTLGGVHCYDTDPDYAVTQTNPDPKPRKPGHLYRVIYIGLFNHDDLTSCWSWFCCHCPPRCRLLRRRPWWGWPPPWWGLRRSWWWWWLPAGGYGLLSLAGDRDGRPPLLPRSHLENVERLCLLWSRRPPSLLEAVCWGGGWGCRSCSWRRGPAPPCCPPWWPPWGWWVWPPAPPEVGGGLYWCCMRSNMSWALLTTDSLKRNIQKIIF